MNVPPISDGEVLIRHIPPEQWMPTSDKPMAAAFKKDRLSVDRQQMRGVDVCCRVRPDWGFVAFSVRTAIDLGQSVEANPLGMEEAPAEPLEPSLPMGIEQTVRPEPEPSVTYNPAHALVIGHKSRATPRHCGLGRYTFVSRIVVFK